MRRIRTLPTAWRSPGSWPPTSTTPGRRCRCPTRPTRAWAGTRGTGDRRSGWTCPPPPRSVTGRRAATATPSAGRSTGSPTSAAPARAVTACRTDSTWSPSSGCSTTPPRTGTWHRSVPPGSGVQHDQRDDHDDHHRHQPDVHDHPYLGQPDRGHHVRQGRRGDAGQGRVGRVVVHLHQRADPRCAGRPDPRGEGDLPAVSHLVRDDRPADPLHGAVFRSGPAAVGSLVDDDPVRPHPPGRRLRQCPGPRGVQDLPVAQGRGEDDRDHRQQQAEPVGHPQMMSRTAAVRCGPVAAAEAAVRTVGACGSSSRVDTARSGSGAPRKDTMDRGGAVLLAQACELAGVRRYLMISAMGVDAGPREGVDDVFAAYLAAKKAADDDVRSRELDWTILRPGVLTMGSGTGHVRLAEHTDRGEVPREDVAAVLLALLDEPRTAGLVLELVSGDTPVAEAVAGVVGSS